ncbi:MAG: hypothetical protein U0U66_02030 [Cytophagaceae bacterium]
MKVVLIFLFSVTSFLIQAQEIHIKVINMQDSTAIKGVKVKSHHDHDLITFSNDSGYFKFNVRHSDTILLQKDYYYPVFFTIKAHQFDSIHVITFYMLPSLTIVTPAQLRSNNHNLQSFEYTFVHNDIGQSPTNITVYHMPEAVVKQQEVYKGKPFRFATIDLDHPNSKSQYQIKK